MFVFVGMLASGLREVLPRCSAAGRLRDGELHRGNQAPQEEGQAHGRVGSKSVYGRGYGGATLRHVRISGNSKRGRGVNDSLLHHSSGPGGHGPLTANNKNPSQHTHTHTHTHTL